MKHQAAIQKLHRAITDFDRHEKGTYGHRTAIGDIVSAIDALVLARVRDTLADKNMDELEALAKELSGDSTA